MTCSTGPASARRVMARPSPERLAFVERRRAPSSVVEHVTFNHGVLGSIPRGPTIGSFEIGDLTIASDHRSSHHQSSDHQNGSIVPFVVESSGCPIRRRVLSKIYAR